MSAQALRSCPKRLFLPSVVHGHPLEGLLQLLLRHLLPLLVVVRALPGAVELVYLSVALRLNLQKS